MFRICITLLFAFVPMLSQVSGWINTPFGYKQQRMNIGEIKQLEYTLSGDTLYSLSKDSLWRIHAWNSEDGVLLFSYIIETKQYPYVSSVRISPDTKTYTILYYQTDGKYGLKIYSCDSNKVLFEMKDINADYAVYDSGLKLLWTSSYDVDQRNYLKLKYSKVFGLTNIYDFNKSTKEPIYSDSLASSEMGIAVGKKTGILISFFKDFEQNEKYEIIKDTLWGGVRIISDSSRNIITLNPKMFGNDVFPKGVDYHCHITKNGTHSLCTVSNFLYHFYSPTGSMYPKVNLFLTPDLIISGNDDEHLLVTKDSTLLFINLYANSLAGSIQTPFNFSTAALRSNKSQIACGNIKGTINLIQFQYTQAFVKNSFETNIQTTYTDSVLTYLPITSKRYAKYLWHFGDGVTDTNRYVTHSYTKPGKYSVKLILTDSSNKVDSVINTDYITILPQLNPAFSGTPTKGKLPFIATFKDESSGSIKTWMWDFGDGTTDSAQHPQHTFSQSRYYDITLTVSDGLRTKSITKKGYIFTDTILFNVFKIVKKSIDNATNSSIDNPTPISYTNEFRKGTQLHNGSLAVIYFNCNTQTGKQSDPVLHTPILTYRLYDGDLAKSDMTSYYSGNSNIQRDCSFSLWESKNIIPYHDTGFVATHPGWNNIYPGMYFSTWKSNNNFDGHNEKHLGWKHDFDGAFLPNYVDVFVFRNGYNTALQFYNRDTVMFAYDSLVGDVTRPVPNYDSTLITIFSNPYSSSADSAQYITKHVYSSNGLMVSKAQIKKTFPIRLTDVIDVDGGGEYIVIGYKPTSDTLVNTPAAGYLCKITVDGKIVWEHTFTNWLYFQRIQRLSHGHFAVWGIPVQGDKHGFLAVNSAGNIISDNRVEDIGESFYPSDMIINTHGKNIWFMGKESVVNQGWRAAIYSCTNPVLDITSDVDVSTLPQTRQINVYPQPTTEDIIVQWTSVLDNTVELNILNSIGEILHTEQVFTLTGLNRKHIITSFLASGIYYLSIKSGGSYISTPFVVIR
ncbi:MAG: PKD domain-containing protein [Candidatus Kapabacteria bacterium]|nr:PKD domain-containing protein [Candidatus Kapabacteria bacterium]